jgi:hypothetical protein
MKNPRVISIGYLGSMLVGRQIADDVNAGDRESIKIVLDVAYNSMKRYDICPLLPTRCGMKVDCWWNTYL